MIEAGRVAAAAAAVARRAAVVQMVDARVVVHELVAALAGQQRHDEPAGRIARHRRQHVMIVGRADHHWVGERGRRDRRQPVAVVPPEGGQSKRGVKQLELKRTSPSRGTHFA